VSTTNSNSQEQNEAQRLILHGVEAEVGEPLEPRTLTLSGGSTVQVDGVALDESVLVEVFAHQGQLKSGQRHKIAGDALKLITIARDHDRSARLVLAFADERLAVWAAGKSWLAASLQVWGIEVIVVKLDDHVISGINTAQARQVMINPPTGQAEIPADA
jgi:hypothetical protein